MANMDKLTICSSYVEIVFRNIYFFDCSFHSLSDGKKGAGTRTYNHLAYIEALALSHTSITGTWSRFSNESCLGPSTHGWKRETLFLRSQSVVTECVCFSAPQVIFKACVSLAPRSVLYRVEGACRSASVPPSCSKEGKMGKGGIV